MLTIEEFKERLKTIRVLPVVTLEKAEDAEPLCRALMAGGLPAAEITFRTEAAADAIREAAGLFPEMLIGAGTVTDARQAASALEAGAAFLVSPGFSPEIARFAKENGIPYLPGICTPTELMAAAAMDIHTVKFFPAEAAGGVDMIQALSAPFPHTLFVPTGGIRPSNLQEYLACPPVLACGGSWMVKPQLIEAGDFARIRELAAEAAGLAQRAD